MQSTRISLLERAGSGSDQAWSDLVQLYQPLVYRLLRRHEMIHHDAEELTQDVMSVVVRELPGFTHSGNPGAFRHWLRRITANRAKGFWRQQKARPVAFGRSSILAMARQLEDDLSDLSRQWNQEHDRYVLRQLMVQIENEFEPSTLRAFQRQVFDGIDAANVAHQLGLSVGAAYSAKSRVLRRLRQAAEGMVDATIFS